MKNVKILEGEIGWDINLTDLAENDKFIINSYGGDLEAGFAIYDFLKGGNYEVGVVGVCASSATIALLGAKNKWGSKNSQFVIHNPWTVQVGDSKDLLKTAEDLKKAEDRLVALYVKELNKDEQYIRDLMLQDKFINAEAALDLGLINEIREDSLQPLEGETAKAKFYNLKRSKVENLTKDQFNTELQKFETSFMDKIKNFFQPKIKNIVLKDVNGAELDFSVDTEEEITIGTTATVDGANASGEYVMPDGKTLVFEAGAITEIKEPEAEGDEEMEALKTENEELKAELEELKAIQANHDETVKGYESKLENLKEDVEAFKNKFSGKVVNNDKPIDKAGEKESTKAFKTKRVFKI
jgi:ATP-dependent protease ClpP protease subunit